MLTHPVREVVRQRRWRVALPAGVAVLAASAVAFVVIRNPYTSSITGPCMLLHATGLYCPGCGGTRAVYELATGDFVGALGMNAFVTLLVVPPAAIGLLWWLLHSLGVNVPRITIGLPAVWTYLGLMAVFAVARNVPLLMPVLAPV